MTWAINARDFRDGASKIRRAQLTPFQPPMPAPDSRKHQVLFAMIFIYDLLITA